MSIEAYFLVGPTASGKSDVAHLLARRMSLPILSIDSMQVYRGLDIGTAKPTPEVRRGITYYGIDIVPPSQDFSVAEFHEYVLGAICGVSSEIIVCGGTGLYSKVLAEGMDDGPEPDEDLRMEWENAVAEGRMGLLKQELKAASPDAFESLSDKDNPRRLIRALERARSGRPVVKGWGKAGAVMTGLDVPPEDLRGRIDERAKKMFKDGLVDETRRALEQYGRLSRTASQAIGYSEAIAVIGGEITEDEALTKVKARTRKLAKKQRTWFRNQSKMDWVSADTGCDVDALADRVEASWKRNGSVALQLGEKA